MRWLALLLLAGAVQAQEVYATDDGKTFVLDAVEGGVVLANADDPADEITLAANCSALHPVLGAGSWSGDDGGFRVMFRGAELHFDGPAPLDAPECGG